MSNFHPTEFPATVYLISKQLSSPIEDNQKCPGCQYEYPNDTIKKHFCPVFDNVKCEKCQFVFPKKAIKRHLFTYYQCKKYYEVNEDEKKELNKILKDRKLDDLDKLPKPSDCFCIRNVEKCHFCDL